MAWSVTTTLLSTLQLFNNTFIIPHTYNNTCYINHKCYTTSNLNHTYSTKISQLSSNKNNTICRAAEYQFPDPIPEFALAETEKFKAHMMKKLSKKARYGDELDEVVGICTEILGKFLHEEYGGPGTLLVLPFAMMAEAVTESGLTGGPQAARAAVKWAQANVDKDWKDWANGNYSADP
ncbi:hypothetical protein vseg_019995 [Gypsophila vaccaria]